ncbi:MAG: plasmid recombination protein [Candidatus Saccharibacteria bacterium]|nr:plasmid recombination protein [Rhodoferax sp.]
MSGAAFLRVKKLKFDGIILKAARHNKREIQSELGAEGSIDPRRSNLNCGLVGPSTAAGVAGLAKSLMTVAGVAKLRKDAVLGIEVIFSLPTGHQLDSRAYFVDCVAWAGGYFGGAANVLAADVHLDESADHCHVLILPLVGSRMDGGRMVGARAKLLAMQSQFFEGVAMRHGLRKAPARLSGIVKQAAAAMVLARLREMNDAALKSAVWASVRDLIESAPESFVMALGISLEPKGRKLKPFVDYVTSKGAGPAREATARRSMYIDFAEADGDKMSIDFANQENIQERCLCPVDIAQIPPLQTHPQPTKQELPQPDSHEHQTPANASTATTATDASTTTGIHHGSHQASAAHATPRNTTTHQPDKDGGRVIEGGVRIEASSDTPAARVATTAADAAAVRDHLRTQPNADDRDQECGEATETTRERDMDHDPRQWDPATGEFVPGTASATKPIRRAVRDAADDWVGASLASRGKTAGRYDARQ